MGVGGIGEDVMVGTTDGVAVVTDGSVASLPHPIRIAVAMINTPSKTSVFFCDILLFSFFGLRFENQDIISFGPP